MAPTEGRVARPERRWGCRRGTPETWEDIDIYSWEVPHPSTTSTTKYKYSETLHREGASQN